jgi:putative salt-induced outer membrane protein
MSPAIRVVSCLLIALPAVALADSAAPAASATPPQGWSGKGQIGYVSSTGNTDADSANAQLDSLYVQNSWKQALHLEGVYSKSADVVSAERWAGLFQSNYQFAPRAFAFGALQYEHDEFSGFVYQGSVTAGAGYQWLTGKTDQLSTQLGVGYRSLRPEEVIKGVDGAVVQRIAEDTSNNAVANVAADYAHVFNASTKVTEHLQLEAGASNTSLQNVLALQVAMSRRLALSLAYTLLDNTKPPADVKNLNTLTTLNLVYQL